MRTIFAFTAVLFVIFMSVFPASAESGYLDNSKQQEAINSLPENVRDFLSSIGIEDFDYNSLNNLSLEKLFPHIANLISSESKNPMKSFAAIIAVMLLYSILYGVKNTLEGTLQPVLSVSVTICIICVLVIPLSGFVTSVVDAVKISSDFMTAYIPLMVFALGLSGQPLSSAGYYSVMMFTSQAVSRLSSQVIAPFMKIFLAISVSSAVSPNINLSGIVRFISKFTRIALVFAMSIFSGILSFKQVLSLGADNISSRAVRLSLSSFVPIVGSALSEAYRTVQGSVGLLKSGVGIISIIASAALFMPSIIQCLFWMLTLGFSKAIAEILNLREPCVLLESVYSVVSTLFAVVLSMMLIFIISSTVVVMLGGSG